VLCWLSVLAKTNPDPSKPLVSIKDIVEAHWREFGRNHYQRYDYEGLDTALAKTFTDRLTALQPTCKDVGRCVILRILVRVLVFF
jgi:phosphoglucomutase